MTMLMENQARPRTHKGQGIASFVIGVTSIAGMATLIAVAELAHIRTGRVAPGLAVVVGIGLTAAVFVELIGIGLGIFGAIDRASKKTFPVLGLTLNVGTVASFLVLALIGLMQGR
jgi:hypothetical protein